MPEIKVPFAQTPYTPAIQEHRMDPNVATLPYKAFLEGQEAYYNNAQKVGQMRTELAINQARSQEAIGKAIGSAFGIAGNLVESAATEQRRAEAEQRRLEHEAKARERELENFLDRQMQTEAFKYKVEQGTKLTENLQTAYQKALSTQPADPSGFTENFMGQFNVLAKQYLDQAPNDIAKMQALQEINQLKLHYNQQAFNNEARGREEYNKITLDNQLESRGNMVSRDPDFVNEAKAEVIDAIHAAPGMSQIEAYNRTVNAVKYLDSMHFVGKVNKDPDTTIDEAMLGKFDHIPPQAFNKGLDIAHKKSLENLYLNTYKTGVPVPDEKVWKDAANTAFKIEQPNLDSGTVTERGKKYIAFMKQNPSLIAPDLTARLSGAINYGSPQERVLATTVIGAMGEDKELLPSLKQFDSNTLNRANLLREMINVGNDPQRAWELVLDKEALNKSKERQEALKEYFKTDTNLDDKEITKTLNSELGGLFTRKDPAGAQVRDLYTRVYKDNFAFTENPEIAKKAAIQAIEKTFSKTKINGYTQYGINPIPEGQVDSFKKITREELSKIIPEAKDEKNFPIYFDINTDHQNKITKEFRVPISTIDKNGVLLPILDPVTGKPLEASWVPNLEREDLKEIEQKARDIDKKVEIAKEQRSFIMKGLEQKNKIEKNRDLRDVLSDPIWSKGQAKGEILNEIPSSQETGKETAQLKPEETAKNKGSEKTILDNNTKEQSKEQNKEQGQEQLQKKSFLDQLKEVWAARRQNVAKKEVEEQPIQEQPVQAQEKVPVVQNQPKEPWKEQKVQTKTPAQEQKVNVPDNSIKEQQDRLNKLDIDHLKLLRKRRR